MARTSSFGDHRSKVSFDRVKPDRPAMGEQPFELSRTVDFTGDEFPSVTWVYDSARDEVTWSRPIEELFGFAAGVRGFQSIPIDAAETAAAPPDSAAPGEAAVPGHRMAPSPPIGGEDVGSVLLAPILGPLRAGMPPSESDVQMAIQCPDGTISTVVVRASPVRTADGADGADDGSVGDEHPEGRGAAYVGVVVDITSQQKFQRELGELVDRYRLLTEVSPDVVFVHQNGRLVYGNRAMASLVGARTDEEYARVVAEYRSRPLTDFMDPADIPMMVDRLSHLTEPGQFFEHGEIKWYLPDGAVKDMEITSIRTTWGGEPAFQVIARDISERRAAEAANRYRASLVAHVSDAIIGISPDGTIESWNEAAENIYGWTEQEVEGRSISAVLTGNRTDSASVLERGRRTHVRKDGSEVDVLVAIDPLIDDTEPTGWVVVCTELTDARQAEAGRRAAEERFEAVVASLSEGIVLFDEHCIVSAHNEAAKRILGERLEAGRGDEIFTGSSIAIEAGGHPLALDQFPHVRTLATGEPEDDVVIGVTDSVGRRQWLSLSSRLLSGAGPNGASMVVCSFTDVTDRREAEAQLHWLAYHDSLTGLGNRELFTTDLQTELTVAMQKKTNIAVLFIDLDRFKLVNDSFGHASGDEVLLELARRFKSAVRGGDLVARFSGDEFVILCRNVHDVSVAVSLAAEYSRLVAEPVPLSSGRAVVVTASVGISFVMRGRQSADDVLQQADAAMFQAKNKGRSRIEVFDDSLRAKSVARLEIYDDLRYSIDNDEFAVHYQPIASVKNNEIVAMEALVRWNHPSRAVGPRRLHPLRRGDRPHLLHRTLGPARSLPDHGPLAKGAARGRGRLRVRQPLRPSTERPRSAGDDQAGAGRRPSSR